MPELTPLDDNRQEHFLNGEDLEPITRREHFYAGRENELPEGHQEPETREEWFIKKYREAGDVTVEEITITENGTTTAPSGKAYSPIHTNVPQPTLTTLDVTENGTYTAPSGTAYNKVDVDIEGYKITEVSGLPSAIATFSDGSALPMPKLEVAVEPQQSGSGDPSPTNIRPISGWSAVDVTRCGKNLFDKSNQEAGWYYGNNIIGSVATIQTGSTSYAWHKDMFIKGGNTYTLSFRMTGDQTIRPAYVLCDSNMIVLSVQYWSAEVTEKTFTITPTEDGYLSVCTPNTNSWDNCNIQLEEESATEYEPYNGQTITIQLGDTYYGGKLDVVSGVLTVDRGYIASYNGETLPSTWISDRDVYAEGTTPSTGAEVVYELATPTTIQLTPTAVKSLQGINNVFADTGDVVEASYWESL